MNTWGIDASLLLQQLVPSICIWREARGEGLDGMAGVAWVILNRMSTRKQTASQVCLAPWQFSSMNAPNDPGMVQWPTPTDPTFQQAYTVWTNCLSGTTPDPTQGATLYYANTIAPPYWVVKSIFTVQIGHQLFYRG
jgi:N-acetylmuramoyl-L-alanine amidase